MTKKRAVAWLICFALVILAPLPVYRLAGERLDVENTENRQMAQRPSFGKASVQAYLDGNLAFRDCVREVWNNLKAYPGLYTSYYNDHLPFRSQLIELGSLASVNLFKDAAADTVMLGKKDWLFYTDEESVEDYKGTNLYSEQELEQIRDNMVSTRDYLDARGIEFVLMIPSNKETIYSEYLPDYVKKRGETTRAQQVVDCLQEAGIRICYPQEELMAYQDQFDLYWHYDTHWNSLGAYIGARALLKELGISIPEVEELSIEQDAFSPYDLAGMMNLKGYYEKNRPADVSYNVSGYPENGRVSLKLEDATELIYQSQAPDGRRLFLVRDSFAWGMASVLASQFSYTYMPHWNGCFEPSMIEREQPDIFVFELVERRLNYLLSFRLSEDLGE